MPAIALAFSATIDSDAATIRRMRAEKSDSTQIFFIGNSYTFYNDMPSMVRDLAASLNLKNGSKPLSERRTDPERTS